jgi:hypothetical protein
MHESVIKLRSVHVQLKAYAKLLKGNEDSKNLLEAGDVLIKRILTWEKNVIQPKQKTFQDVINFNNKLNSQLINLAGYINQAAPKVTSGAKTLLNDLLRDWNVYKAEHDTIITTEMSAYNDAYKNLKLPALIIKD